MTKLLPFLAAGVLVLAGCGSSSSGSGEHNDSDVNVTVNDPYYRYAWHLHRPEAAFADRYGILPDAHIRIEEAWEKSRGRGVTVAVIDDYFDPAHPDIAANVVGTYNARTGGTDVTSPSGASTHGQWCSGLIAAVADTAGVIGAAPEAKLILIGSAYDTDADIIRAFEYARTHGADIISCSWGSYVVSQAVSDEIRSVYEQNITVIFAAGNDGRDLDEPGYNDESELPWVIGVTSSSETGDRCSYSNYGSAIDLMAPGGESIGLPTTDEISKHPNDEWLGKGYRFFHGTSASAPVVAATAALLKSRDPSLTPERLRTLLIEPADKTGNAPYGADGFELRHAFGKLNAGRAMEVLTRR